MPRVQVHDALGIKRGRIEIVGVTRGQLAHGTLVGAIEFVQVGLGVIGITNNQGVDVGALRLGRVHRQSHGLLHRLVAGFFALGIDRQIVIGTEGESHAPPGHGQFGIEPGGLLEGAARFVVIKSVNEIQPLIEESLGLLVPRGNGMVHIAQASHQPRGRSFGLGRRH